MAKGREKIETPVVSDEKIETPVVSESSTFINVFNKSTALVERINTSEFNADIHRNRNTHEEFTNDEIESFTK